MDTMTTEEFASLSKDKSRFFIVVMSMRPNTRVWSMDLEYTHYVPDTPRNDLFSFYQSKWQDIHWSVISIPIEDRHLAEEMASKHNLRIADGIPVILGGEKPEAFPLKGDNVFTIENTNEKLDDEEERRQCDDIQNRFNAMVQALTATNVHQEAVKVKHSELRRFHHSQSIYRKWCPKCDHGILLVTRDNDTFELQAFDRCILCGQLFEYLDIEEMRQREKTNGSEPSQNDY